MNKQKTLITRDNKLVWVIHALQLIRLTNNSEAPRSLAAPMQSNRTKRLVRCILFQPINFSSHFAPFGLAFHNWSLEYFLNRPYNYNESELSCQYLCKNVKHSICRITIY